MLVIVMKPALWTTAEDPEVKRIKSGVDLQYVDK